MKTELEALRSRVLSSCIKGIADGEVEGGEVSIIVNQIAGEIYSTSLEKSNVCTSDLVYDLLLKKIENSASESEVIVCKLFLEYADSEVSGSTRLRMKVLKLYLARLLEGESNHDYVFLCHFLDSVKGNRIVEALSILEVETVENFIAETGEAHLGPLEGIMDSITLAKELWVDMASYEALVRRVSSRKEKNSNKDEVSQIGDYDVLLGVYAEEISSRSIEQFTYDSIQRTLFSCEATGDEKVKEQLRIVVNALKELHLKLEQVDSALGWSYVAEQFEVYKGSDLSVCIQYLRALAENEIPQRFCREDFEGVAEFDLFKLGMTKAIDVAEDLVIPVLKNAA